MIDLMPRYVRSPALPFELRYSVNTGACYKKHTHREFSVGVVDGGGMSEYCHRNEKQTIYRGSTVMINPEEAHSCNPARGTNWSYKMLYVDPDWLTNLQRSLSGSKIDTYQPFQKNRSDCPRLYEDFQYLVRSLVENESSIAQEEIAVEFFSRLYLKYSNGHSVEKASKNALDIAFQFISDNFDKNLSIPEIAKISGMSEYYLIHSFRKRYGITPHAYQIVLRINRAKQLLKNGEKIASIATDLGFADQSHFHRNFKKIVAATPGQYKSQS